MSDVVCVFCGARLPAPPAEGPPVCLRCRNRELPGHLSRLRANLMEIDRLAPRRDDDGGEDDGGLPPE